MLTPMPTATGTPTRMITSTKRRLRLETRFSRSSRPSSPERSHRRPQPLAAEPPSHPGIQSRQFAWSGQDHLLEKTLTALRARNVSCAVIEGDQATDLDAKRIARTGVSVFQIETGRSCHLDALQVQRALGHIEMPDHGLLFIENVGNLICPTEFKLGEHERVTIVSTAEGHDKPAKYPLAFRTATAVVISKIDLLPYLDFDLVEAKRLIHGLNPTAPIFELSATRGDGMDGWLSWLQHAMQNHG
jgi:hydrogenase nickel incorporation protein HypB